MRVINLVDNISQINFGLWSAAIICCPWLKLHGNVESHLWFPASSAPPSFPEMPGVQPRALVSTATRTVPTLIQEFSFSPKDTLICTHGSWRYPTRWGHAFKKLNYKWIYAPHGMLEPWDLAQKALRKWLYFNFVEARLVRQADAVRAVSLPEFGNLSKHFKRVELIPNSVLPRSIDMDKRWQNGVNTVLYMARLHHKKGVIPLVQAWRQSPLSTRSDWQLRIAGPDDGELDKLRPLLAQAKNVEYLGPIYGSQKINELERAHYYILPSLSEGFPTSVVEAMQAGLIPIISDGANFPEVFKAGLGIRISQEVNDIVHGFAALEAMPSETRKKLSKNAASFIQAGYLVDQIGPAQFALFTQLLAN